MKLADRPIMATLAVIAALLPRLLSSGLYGPYMSSQFDSNCQHRMLRLFYWWRLC